MKTTTIGMILGLVTPSLGEILIENKNINLFRDGFKKRFNSHLMLNYKTNIKQNLEIYGSYMEYKIWMKNK